VDSTSPLYRGLVALAVPLVPLVLRDARQRRAHAGRLGAATSMADWARTHRDSTRPLAWFHAPSVGEGLQARAVFEALRTLRPELQLVYTHFSSSAEAFAASLAVDYAGYLPYDQPAAIASALDALSPDLLVFTKLDLWPELATQAAARGTRVAMVAATVSPVSGRLRWPARAVTRAGYQALSAVGAIANDDASRLLRLGVPSTRISVTGDPRVDSVLAVVDGIASDDPLARLADPDTTLVAGSSWPGDESVLLAAFAIVRRTHPSARLILVPHEPTDAHLVAIETQAAQHALPQPVRLGALRSEERPTIVLGDRVGVLARLYGSGGMAHVGGGFGDAGIHSVLEPAAWARPVIIGPRDRGSRDAAVLRAAGGLLTLPAHGAAEQLAATWSAWLADPMAAAALGQRNRAALEGERGAAGRSAELLVSLLR
jgi:3-deoxy-D-manno-octulosonic-acid transferase